MNAGTSKDPSGNHGSYDPDPDRSSCGTQNKRKETRK